jgi:DNA-binding transcriptional ArsR family regulator
MPRYADADARLLRTMNHPTRGAILYELFARGESTATELAAAIDEPVNSVSFHLRQLAKLAVVEEVPRPDGDRRQRWWRVPHEGFMIDEQRIRREPGGDATMRARRRHVLAWWRALLERYFLTDHPPGEVWNINDIALRLTDDEAERLTRDLLEVLARWRRGSRDRSGGEESRRTYLGFAIVLPHQPDLGRVKRS